MRTRKTSLRRDNRGNFTREIGYLDQVRTKQPKFNLGTDERQAEARIARLIELFSESMKACGGQPIWTGFALYAAKLISKGIYRIPYPPQWDTLDQIDHDLTLEDKAIEYVQMLRVEQQRHPSLEIIPSELEMYGYGVKANREIEKRVLKSTESKLKDLGVLPSHRNHGDKFIAGTLDDAFNAYIEHIEKNGHRLDSETLKPSQRKRIEYVEALRQQHTNQTLMELSSFDAAFELLSHWMNRPEFEPGKRYKAASAKHRCRELQRFLRWLHSTPRFAWTMPDGLRDVRLRFVDLEEDNCGTALLRKKVYSPDELGLISSYASNEEKLHLYLGVNCAFGASELGRVLVNDVLLNHEHEFADYLNFATTKSDSFIRILRMKSKMFGEWLLWPETVEILRWGIDRARNRRSKYIASEESGETLYQEKFKNPQAKFANIWNDLIARVRADHPALPKLPYGSLRDTLPDTLRHRKDDSLASICLCHRTAYKPDTLLEAYGNRPFGRLHTAIRELHEHFKPMFR